MESEAKCLTQATEARVSSVGLGDWRVGAALKARLDKVTWWLERARPDVLLMQETKLADTDAPAKAFRCPRMSINE